MNNTFRIDRGMKSISKFTKWKKNTTTQVNKNYNTRYIGLNSVMLTYNHTHSVAIGIFGHKIVCMKT